jgi:hypothetical protein
LQPLLKSSASLQELALEHALSKQVDERRTRRRRRSYRRRKRRKRSKTYGG